MSIVDQQGAEDHDHSFLGMDGQEDGEDADGAEDGVTADQNPANVADEITRSVAEIKAAVDNHVETIDALRQRVNGMQELGAALTEDICWLRHRSVADWLTGGALPTSRIDSVYKQIVSVRSRAGELDANVVALTRLVKRVLVPTIFGAAAIVALAVII